MNSPMFRYALALCVFFLTTWSRAQDDLPTRTLPEIGTGPALLIGVKTYEKRGVASAFADLPGIEADLAVMEKTVRALGWNDVNVLLDPTSEQMRAAIDAFGAKAAASANTSLFYFSGHGVLHRGRNYLIPSLAPIAARGHLEQYAVPAEHLQGYFTARSGPALMFLDACRNNTLPASDKGASDLLTLARRPGFFIGYATAEDRTAGATDKGSVYTAALARRLLTPGRSLDDLYAGVIADVEKSTQGTARVEDFQEPQKQSALRFVFHLKPALASKQNEDNRPLTITDAPKRFKSGLFSIDGIEVKAIPPPTGKKDLCLGFVHVTNNDWSSPIPRPPKWVVIFEEIKGLHFDTLHKVQYSIDRSRGSEVLWALDRDYSKTFTTKELYDDDHLSQGFNYFGRVWKAKEIQFKTKSAESAWVGLFVAPPGSGP